MASRTIETSILTDIANAIRWQAGTSTLFKPREMAAAVLALDGTNAGGYVEQPYMALEKGVLQVDVFGDIGDAIRAQNGSSVQYTPRQMAPAIRALTWDLGLRPRAVFTDDGTLEFNYLSSRQSTLGGTIVSAFEVDPSGYAASGDVPWRTVHNDVKHVYFHSSFASVGVTNMDHWFRGYPALLDVTGFENMSSITSAKQAFASCSKLDSIYATSFTNNISSTGTNMFSGCSRLVGGHGKVPNTGSCSGSVCKLGTTGVLTDPNDDLRRWFYAHLYSDGSGVISASSTPDPNKTLVGTDRICSIAFYPNSSHSPWGGLNSHALTSVEFASDLALFGSVNLRCLFSGCDNLTSVSGVSNLSQVVTLEHTFANCSALTSLDLRGLDPWWLSDCSMAFGGCSNLVTILVDSTWELDPYTMGTYCFNNCQSLVGGNGTTWSSSNIGYQYMVVDKPGQAGYLTGA